MQGIFEIVRRVFGGSRSKRQCRIILTTNPEGPLHLQLWTLVATLPLSRKKWKAAAQKFIILGVPMTGYGRLPTAIQGLQFRYQRSWKGLVRNPKADAGECYY